MRVRHALLLSLLVLPASLGAQASPVHPTADDTLVLSHEFTTQRVEFARVDLQAGQVYRIEVEDGFNVQIRSLHPGDQAPRYVKTEPYPRASRTATWQIMPFVSTEYEVRVGEIRGAAAPLKIYWDASATARRQKQMHS